MKLYQHPVSTSCRPVMMFIADENLEVEQQIVDILKKDGIKIARRTVAKYRGQLNIPSSNRRKKPY